MCTLREWRRRNQVTQERFEELTGIPQALISKYERGTNAPGLQNALAIQRATNGEVPVEAWEKRSSEPKAAAG